jgi:hypothetical protein
MPAPAEVPDWLQDLAPEEPAPSVAEEAAAPPVAEEVASEMLAPAEVPDWLQEAAPPTPPFIDESLIAGAEAPEWLAEIKEQVPSPAPAALTPPFPVEPDTTAAEAAGLARAEIPAWLEAMRPTTEVIEETIEEEPAETEGLLQGLRGVLSPLPMVNVTRARESAMPAEINQATLARAQLLQSLLTRPTEAPQPKVRKRTGGMSELVPRLFIAVVLFVVVGGMLLVSQDPALNGHELNSVARAILEHLIERKANISIASTQPEGLAVAEVLRGDINSQEQYVSEQQPKFEYAKESPGYRPGNATGVSQILASIDRPAMIIVLAAQPESLRWWIEQTQAHYGAAPPPIAAGVSAALEIASSPYLDANADQLKGTVSGLGGAVAYQTQRGKAGQTSRQLDALAAGHLVIVASMLAGAAFYAVGGSRRRGE